MPATHVVPVAQDTRLYAVQKNGVIKHATILTRRGGDAYVHYLDTDKRMDEWVPQSACTLVEFSGKRPGEGSSSNAAGADTDHSMPYEDYPESSRTPQEVVLTEEEFDLRHHQQLHSQKNFDIVIFDTWKIKPWYFSPYPLMETEVEDMAGSSGSQLPKIPGVARTTARSHGRTSDMLAGGLQRQTNGESMLWVCHFCFKYMVDGILWELHKKDCKMKHPPGRKVYQRGAHTIWEVDGAREKLYCQNLALFGKLFIDVKTLFFDCDNFLFYILTDAKSSEDHILGFFSKEKLSYDDYNLACIMTLPQYQRKGYGMLLIEFSYELSRREGKVGSPERPLSDLGLRSYLAYWVSTIIRFLRRVLSALPPGITSIKNENEFPEFGPDSYISGEVERSLDSKKKKKTKGFDGEVLETNIEQTLGHMPMKNIHEPVFTTKRSFITKPRPDGGAETHVKVECTLADIARATNIRPDDAAFALNECGLLMRRMSTASTRSASIAGSTTHQDGGTGTGNGTGAGAGSNLSNWDGTEGSESTELMRESDTVVITREMVERVAAERGVKIMYLDLSCVLI
ncbi:acyl-CoA N-acyltransferase [Agrocybe pediades]|nr:acyl-CoA N-acyltransferase [Agrocybe pediades]